MVLEIINGVEGECVSLDDTRICGPKAWGGGIVIKAWKNIDPYKIRELANIEIRSIRKTKDKEHGRI